MREVLQSVDGFRLQGRRAAANLKPNHSANEPEICTEVHSALQKSQRQSAAMESWRLSHLSSIANDSTRLVQFNEMTDTLSAAIE